MCHNVHRSLGQIIPKAISEEPRVFLLLHVISVEVYCAYKKTSPIECKSGDCSGEAALLSRLIWASACSLCIGYQYIHALWTFMYYMYIC